MQHLVPESCDTKMVEAHPLSRDVTDELFLGYIQDVTKLASSTYLHIDKTSDRRLSSQTKFPPFVYTPMHGVGLNIFQKVIATIGLEKYMHAVPEQVPLQSHESHFSHIPIQSFQLSNILILKKMALW